MGVVVECEIALKSLLYEDFKSYYIHLMEGGAGMCFLQLEYACRAFTVESLCV